LALFGRRPLQRVVSLVIPATKKLHKSGHQRSYSSGMQRQLHHLHIDDRLPC
jgi:hypothetical protein